MNNPIAANLVFSSKEFPVCEEDIQTLNIDVFGKRLADFLATEFTRRGFDVDAVVPRTWGWLVGIHNDEFPISIGCGCYPEMENGFLCFISPSKSWVRRFFRKINTVPALQRISTALESILIESEKVTNLRWIA